MSFKSVVVHKDEIVLLTVKTPLAYGEWNNGWFGRVTEHVAQVEYTYVPITGGINTDVRFLQQQTPPLSSLRLAK